MQSTYALPIASAVRPVSEGGRRLLALILKSNGLSQAAITKGLDLAQPTVTRLLQGFQQDGMIVTAPNSHSDRPGHPSVHVTLNADFAYAIGVSILGDVLSMTLMDFAGRVRCARSAAMPAMSEKKVSGRLTAFKADILKKSGIDPRRLIGAGVGLSGFFVGERQWFNPPLNMDDWALRDIESILEDALGTTVAMDNDGTVAAIGESLFGIGRRCAHFAYLHLTNGFGGGLITNSRAVRGFHGNAGEFGGIWGLCCPSPHPNLELLRTCVNASGPPFESVEKMVRTINVATPGVNAWLDKAVPAFELLSGILACTVDPQMIVIGGRLPRSIAEALAARIAVTSPSQRRNRPMPLPAIAVAEVEGDPVAVGAAAMAMQRAFFA